ncbi:MAG TPA: DUF6046 domain-containing protein [Cytophagaceae bacterium]|jgi:hypothetical protein|nr:DUF6046 domain-containing protein [Cytophagaceae bacterium]
MAIGDYKVILNGFGLDNIKPKAFSTSGLKNLAGETGYYTAPPSEKPNSFGLSSGNATSALGTPVFGKLFFLPGVYNTVKFGKKIVLPYSALSLDTVLITVSMSKNIIPTSITGRKGTIKEYITDGDFQVNIKGSLVDDSSGRYPIEQMAALRSICNASEAIKVKSDFLLLFSITHLVIQSYNFNQSEGYSNVQLFDLNCVSDIPVELSINSFI